MKDREKKILEYMKTEIREKGYPPTVREICAALGIKSTSTVHKDIANLEKEGYLKKDPARPRALLVVDEDFDQLAAVRAASGAGFGAGTAGAAAPETAGTGNVERTDIVDIPLVGRIAAGTPILAEQNIEDSFPIPSRFVSGTSFMLTVRGESMIEAGIMDGDYILVEQCNTARRHGGRLRKRGHRQDLLQGRRSHQTAAGEFLHEPDHRQGCENPRQGQGRIPVFLRIPFLGLSADISEQTSEQT